MTQTVTRSSAAPIVLGAVAFGKPSERTRDHPLSSDAACEDLLRAFAEYGGMELDTARVYQNGNCEEVLGRIPTAGTLRIATKYHPNLPGGPILQLDQSLAALGRKSVPIYYLHMPASEIMLEDTLAEIHSCYAADKFEEFGLSNFPAWQVVEICQFCQRAGYVLPTVYQGVYNALNRTAEYELLPVPLTGAWPLQQVSWVLLPSHPEQDWLEMDPDRLPGGHVSASAGARVIPQQSKLPT